MKKWLSRIAFGLTVLIATAALAAVIVWNRLPSLLESRILPHLANQLGFAELQGEVRRVGPRGLDLGRVRLLGEQGEVLTADSLRLDYSLPGLWRRRLKALRIGGLRLHVEIGADGIQPPGGWPPELLELLRDDPERDPSPPPRFHLGEVSVEHSELLVEWRQQTHRLPFELRTGPLSDDMEEASWQMVISPRGQALSIAGNLNLTSRRATVETETSRLALAHFADLLEEQLGPSPPDIEISWRSRLEFELQPPGLTAFAATGRLHRLHARIGEIGRLRSRNLAGERQDVEFTLEFDGKAGSLRIPQAHFALDGWHMAGEDFTLAIVPPTADQPEWELTADLDFRLSEVNGRMQLAGGTSRWQARADASGEWRWNLAARIREAFWQAAEFRVNVGGLNLEASGAGRPDRQRIETELTIADWHFASAAIRATGSPPEMTVVLDQAQKLDWHVSLSGLSMIADTALLELHEIEFSGHSLQPLHFESLLETPIQAELAISSGNLEDDARRLRIGEIALRLPLHWPPTGETEEPTAAGTGAGELKVAQMQWNGYRLGGVTGKIAPSGLGFKLDAEYLGDPDLLPGFKAELSGKADWQAGRGFAASGSGRVVEWQWPKDFDLARLHPAAAGISATAEFDLETRFTLDRRGPRLAFEGVARNGEVEIPEYDARLHGLVVFLDFPDLLAIRSAPRQMISFEAAELGNLTFSRGMVEFRVDGPRNYFIEKAEAGWVGGRLSLFALHLAPWTQNYQFDIFCDGLELSRLISQLNLGTATGEGRINGRIPVDYRPGRLRLEQGFLYSTPGLEGTIRIAEDDLLESMIPTGGSGQLALTKAALRDFKYRWARLQLAMDGDDLQAQFQFDGAPADILPFVYNQEIGDWVRVEVKGAGSRFEAIRLDLNFNLPLDQVLGVGFGLRDLFK